MNYKENDYVMFMDSIGHIFLGKFEAETDSAVKVRNPLIISSEEKAGQGMNVQFFPLLFREFQGDKNEATKWTLPKSMFAFMDTLQLDIRLTTQYERIFAPITNVMPHIHGTPSQVTNANSQTKSDDTPVIKLFDE